MTVTIHVLTLSDGHFARATDAPVPAASWHPDPWIAVAKVKQRVEQRLGRTCEYTVLNCGRADETILTK